MIQGLEKVKIFSTEGDHGLIPLPTTVVIYGSLLTLLNLSFTLIYKAHDAPNFGQTTYLGFGILLTLVLSKGLGFSPISVFPSPFSSVEVWAASISFDLKLHGFSVGIPDSRSPLLSPWHPMDRRICAFCPIFIIAVILLLRPRGLLRWESEEDMGLIMLPHPSEGDL